MNGKGLNPDAIQPPMMTNTPPSVAGQAVCRKEAKPELHPSMRDGDSHDANVLVVGELQCSGAGGKAERVPKEIVVGIGPVQARRAMKVRCVPFDRRPDIARRNYEIIVRVARRPVQ